MDITKLAPQPTATITLNHPVTGEPLVTSDGREMHVVVYGKDTRQYKAALANMYRSQLEMAKSDPDWVPSDDEHAELVAPVFEAVIESVLYEDNDGIKTDVAEFARRPELQFFRDEIDQAIGNRQNFMQA